MYFVLEVITVTDILNVADNDWPKRTIKIMIRSRFGSDFFLRKFFSDSDFSLSKVGLGSDCVSKDFTHVFRLIEKSE